MRNVGTATHAAECTGALDVRTIIVEEEQRLKPEAARKKENRKTDENAPITIADEV